MLRPTRVGVIFWQKHEVTPVLFSVQAPEPCVAPAAPWRRRLTKTRRQKRTRLEKAKEEGKRGRGSIPKLSCVLFLPPGLWHRLVGLCDTGLCTRCRSGAKSGIRHVEVNGLRLRLDLLQKGRLA